VTDVPSGLSLTPPQETKNKKKTAKLGNFAVTPPTHVQIKLVLNKEASSQIYFHLFQEREVPGEPLTPKDFENAENLGKQHIHFAKT
jgi:hypothetical protein